MALTRLLKEAFKVVFSSGSVFWGFYSKSLFLGVWGQGFVSRWFNARPLTLDGWGVNPDGVPLL